MVYDCGIAPAYFLDEMTITEVEAVMERFNADYRNEWEQVRFGAFVNARVQGAKVKKPSELITFAWEKTKVPESRKLTTKEMASLKADMQASYDKFVKGEGEIWKPE